jgi:hypothetical protein
MSTSIVMLPATRQAAHHQSTLWLLHVEQPSASFAHGADAVS